MYRTGNIRLGQMLGMLVLLWAMWMPSLHGQPSSSTTHLLKINPLSLFISTLNVKLERRLNTRFSGQLGLHIGSPRLQIGDDTMPNAVQYYFAGITPELRFYVAFNRVAQPKGLFVGTYCRYSLVKERYRTMVADPDRAMPTEGIAFLRRHVASLGFLIGYQLFFKDRIGLEIYVGPQYSSSATKQKLLCTGCDGDEHAIGRPGLKFDGIEPRAGLAIGYAF
jgi:Protein of unknown function (DUF3575)